jgi:hypothetical protein
MWQQENRTALVCLYRHHIEKERVNVRGRAQRSNSLPEDHQLTLEVTGVSAQAQTTDTDVYRISTLIPTHHHKIWLDENER